MRRREPIKPDSRHQMQGFEDLSGLGGAHRKTVESWVRQVGDLQQVAL